MTSPIDPHGLELFRIQARITLLEAGALAHVPITDEDEANYEWFQWARMQLYAYAEDAERRTRGGIC